MALAGRQLGKILAKTDLYVSPYREQPRALYHGRRPRSVSAGRRRRREGEEGQEGSATSRRSQTCSRPRTADREEKKGRGRRGSSAGSKGSSRASSRGSSAERAALGDAVDRELTAVREIVLDAIVRFDMYTEDGVRAVMEAVMSSHPQLVQARLVQAMRDLAAEMEVDCEEALGR